jgi:hypothetical protein
MTAKILNHQLFLFLLFLFLSLPASGQEAQDATLRLFINCNFCDMAYLRDELNYVDHVRDQALADVMVQVNRVGNASGGSTYDLRFIGLEAYEDIVQELEMNTTPIYTPDEIRRKLRQRIELGLVPYLVRAGMVEQITVEVESPERTPAQRQPQTDPWNFWIFEVYAEGELEKESFDSQVDMEAGFSADRITEDWRIESRAEINYFQRNFDNNEDQFESYRRRHYLWGKAVRSLGPHWSVGASASFRHDTYDNVQFSSGLAPAVEYSLYPYSEVIRREITFSYLVEGRHYNYIETTIYEKDAELLFRQAFNINLRFRQPWGDIFSRLEASTFLHDLSKNRVELFGRVNIRVWKGLAVRFSANIDLIRDQLFLPAGNASVEDILLRQRQIATNFFLGVGAGISYTFGSAYNNIINTRL